MNDDHPTSAPDPGAPYRHPELSPRQTFEQWQRERREHLRRLGIPVGEFIPERIDLMHTAEARRDADRFGDWLDTWLSFGATRDELKVYLPPHLLDFWMDLERQAVRRERLQATE